VKEVEFWRDLETFGSLTFYVAVLVRSLVGLAWWFFEQLLGAFVVSQLLLMLVSWLRKGHRCSHGASGAILLVLINNFYQSRIFLPFSILIFGLACVGHMKLRKQAWQDILIGFAIGIASAILAIVVFPSQ